MKHLTPVQRHIAYDCNDLNKFKWPNGRFTASSFLNKKITFRISYLSRWPPLVTAINIGTNFISLGLKGYLSFVKRCLKLFISVNDFTGISHTKQYVAGDMCDRQTNYDLNKL